MPIPTKPIFFSHGLYLVLVLSSPRQVLILVLYLSLYSCPSALASSCQSCVFVQCLLLLRRKIRLIEGNAKCRHLKIFTCKGTLRQAFICLRPRTPYHPHLTHYIRVYTIQYNNIIIHTGKGGGELNQREGEKGNSSQSWVKNINMTEFISSL
jgi:hypothetical protein